jgi:chemotaxis protein MotB
VEPQSVIIKKVKKRGHAAHHGGSWKVAYADFVTAMMAFFLLLWLVSMVSPEKRARVSRYFNEYDIFDKSGSSIMDYHQPEKLDLDGQKKAGGQGAAEELARDLVEAAQERFMNDLKHEIETKLADLKDQILVHPFEQGVRIEVMERDGSPMFPLGSAEMTPAGRKILSVITRSLSDSRRRIAVEGHTDARVYTAQRRYSNWELSTERASAARLELEKAGLPPERLVRVAGFAATEPLVRENPLDPRNRRISILVFN